MNATHARSAGVWSRGRWGTMLSAILAGELALLFLLSRRPGDVPTAIRPSATSINGLNWVPDVATSLEIRALFPDAAVFGLPSPDGFAAKVWKPDHTIRAAPPEPAFDDLPSLAPSLPLSPLPTAAPVTVAGQVTLPQPRHYLAAIEPKTNQIASALRIDAGLPGWQLQPVATLPTWPHTDVLGPSYVDVMVDSGGTVVAAILLPAGSGLPAADRKALELAGTLRFQPPASAGENQPPAWGRLAFVWQSRPPETASMEAKSP